MFDLHANAIGEGKSGFIRCIDKPLIYACMHDEITIISYDNDVTLPTLDFFKYLHGNGICMKIFFKPHDGFQKEHNAITILKDFENFIDDYTPYASYEGIYGFKLVFKNGVSVNDDAASVNEIYIVLLKLCKPRFVLNLPKFQVDMQNALDLLHLHGYCHNDLSLNNVVLCSGKDKLPQYKLIDFESMSTCGLRAKEIENHFPFKFMRRSNLGGRMTRKNKYKSSKSHKSSKSSKSHK